MGPSTSPIFKPRLLFGFPSCNVFLSRVKNRILLYFYIHLKGNENVNCTMLTTTNRHQHKHSLCLHFPDSTNLLYFLRSKLEVFFIFILFLYQFMKSINTNLFNFNINKLQI